MLLSALLLEADNLLELLIFSSLHEIGHLAALYISGGKADEIKLSFYGFAIKYSVKLKRNREFLVLLAGPAVNLVLFILFRNGINLMLFLFNILPIYPLDGGRILNLYMIKVNRYISFIFLFFLFCLSFYLLFKFGVFSMLLICFYLTVYSIMY